MSILKKGIFLGDVINEENNKTFRINNFILFSLIPIKNIFIYLFFF